MTKRSEHQSMAELVARYNDLGPKRPAGPKTFSSKKKAIAAIRSLQIVGSAEKAGTAAEPKPTKPKQKNESPRLVRVAAEELLLQDDPALSYADILGRIRDEFPESSTTIACLRWYAVRLRERDERVPARPRAPRKKEG